MVVVVSGIPTGIQVAMPRIILGVRWPVLDGQVCWWTISAWSQGHPPIPVVITAVRYAKLILVWTPVVAMSSLPLNRLGTEPLQEPATPAAEEQDAENAYAGEGDGQCYAGLHARTCRGVGSCMEDCIRERCTDCVEGPPNQQAAFMSSWSQQTSPSSVRTRDILERRRRTGRHGIHTNAKMHSTSSTTLYATASQPSLGFCRVLSGQWWSRA